MIKKTIFSAMLMTVTASFAIEWNIRNFELIDPASLWDVFVYTQEDADQNENITEDLIGKTWGMKYNPDYELDAQNSIQLDLDLWAKNGWFTLVWVDDATGETHRIANSAGCEGEGHYRLTIRIDKNHELADKLMYGQGQLTSVQMINREKPQPPYGNWYAMQYYVDILEWQINEDVDESFPPSFPEDGFPTRSQISFDPVSGLMTIHFERISEEGQRIEIDASDYGIQVSTNLVSNEWFHLGDGLSAVIDALEDNMFFRLFFKEE
ncbi:hypothetical protein P4B35_00840 [Pontiellaceae bacterium B12227]|nr:hypothetical protein [Pontiellaceae bacterium B12227]